MYENLGKNQKSPKRIHCLVLEGKEEVGSYFIEYRIGKICAYLLHPLHYAG